MNFMMVEPIENKFQLDNKSEWWDEKAEGIKNCEVDILLET